MSGTAALAGRDLRDLIGRVRPETARLLYDIAAQDVADRAWNEQIGPFLTADDVARLLARDGRPITRQAVAKRRSLLAIRAGSGAAVYPVFQFDGRRVLRGLPPVLEILRPVAEALLVASWLTSPHPDLGGRTPVAALRDGEAMAVRDLAQGMAATLAA